jgi:predicted AAA+ superfamily ATPase
VTYRPRVVDHELEERLQSAGGVLIEGPKACGKTETAGRAAGSAVFLDVDENARQAASITPRRLLEGDSPRLLDEWQLAPEIWNHVRREIDARREPGQFILTGSAIPAEDALRHSGAGRIGRLSMRPMSLFELGYSTGEVSVSQLLERGVEGASDPGLDVAALADLITIGGWPRHLGMSVAAATRATRDYVAELTHTDLPSVDGVRRDPLRVSLLLASMARNVATYASMNTLAADAGGSDGSLSRHSVSDYITALQRLLILEDQPAWSPHIRSRARLRQASKRHFIDPSLAVAALGVTPGRLMDDLNFLGFLFESLLVRDLRIYSQAADARVLQYRDGSGMEVDAIVEAADGRWAAFEVKLGGRFIDDAAANLLDFAAKVDTGRSGEPAALAVITASGFGFQRPDGVWVLPIGSLGP